MYAQRMAHPELFEDDDPLKELQKLRAKEAAAAAAETTTPMERGFEPLAEVGSVGGGGRRDPSLQRHRQGGGGGGDHPFGIPDDDARLRKPFLPQVRSFRGVFLNHFALTF